jgi:SAM-dependent methyltransferase
MTESEQKNCRVCGGGDCPEFVRTPAQMFPAGGPEFAFRRCGECGYVFIAEPVAPAELGRYYTDSYLPYRGAEAWGKHAPTVAAADRKLIESRASLVAGFAALGSDSCVLDIGCGRPDFLVRCVERFACRAFGLDFSDSGWRGLETLPPRLELAVGEVRDLPRDLMPDAVTMWHYLEHDYDPAATLREVAARSKASTRLIIEVPDFDSWTRRRFGRNWAGYHTPRHISVFSESNLKMLLEKNGWRVVEFRRRGTLDPFVIYWMSLMEEKGFDWSRPLESEFAAFVLRMLAFWPRKLLQGRVPLGLMTAVAEPLQS